MTDRPHHFAAIVGGAIASSVAADSLPEHEIEAVVIEQTKGPTAD